MHISIEQRYYGIFPVINHIINSTKAYLIKLSGLFYNIRKENRIQKRFIS